MSGVVTRSGVSGTASGGTFIRCAEHGCRALYNGSAYTNTRGARQEARALGWLVDQPGTERMDISGRRFRLDYCPEHREDQ